MPNTIQPREYSKGSGLDDISYNSDGNPNLLNANRNGNGRYVNAYYDKPDNRWNRNDGFAFAVPQLSSFLSHFIAGRVLFCKLPAPSAKHFADFLYLERKRNIFFVIKRFCFPEYH